MIVQGLPLDTVSPVRVAAPRFKDNNGSKKGVELKKSGIGDIMRGRDDLLFFSSSRYRTHLSNPWRGGQHVFNKAG